MTLTAYWTTSVNDLAGGELDVSTAFFDDLVELLERQQSALIQNTTLNAVQREWLRQDISVVENELAHRWETGKEQ